MVLRRVAPFFFFLCLSVAIVGDLQASLAEAGDIAGAYLESLWTADSFLWSWQRRDPKGEGAALLSDRLRAKAGSQQVSLYMSGLSNPYHAAFEIDHGCRIDERRFRFNVALYFGDIDSKTGFAYTGVLEVARQGRNWRIDALPPTDIKMDNPDVFRKVPCEKISLQPKCAGGYRCSSKS